MIGFFILTKGGEKMETTTWQRHEVTQHYLEQVRGGIPFGAEQAKIMLQVVNHFTPNPKRIMDLGCGNGFLAEILLKSYKAASATPKIEKLHDELFIDHLSPHNKRDRQEVAKEYYNRPDQADNILERVDIQVNWLREIGFKHSDCYFKWMELAVFGGVK